MSVWEHLFLGYQLAVVAYFVLLNLTYSALAFVGLRTVIVYSRDLSQIALRDLLERDVFRPVSILVPAYNEEKSIVASVRSFLNLQYPLFEVIVVSDGSTDGTLDRLTEAFSLVDDPRVWAKRLRSEPVRRVMRSLRFPNLVVVDKENGGKSDALNVAIDLARYPLIAPVDADSLLDAQAILRATRLFVEDDTVIAVGGTVRPLNGAIVEGGRPTALQMPRGWLERLQIVEYARAFFLGRAGWTRFGTVLIISGAFGLFRRDAVVRVGGFWTGTVGEDMELVMRLHREHLRAKVPYRIVVSPDPICWTEVPSDLGTLLRQRNRWHRGLWTNLWRHRAMLFDPRCGRIGMLAVPYFWLFEALAPAIEVSGFVTFGVAALLGMLEPGVLWLFLAVAVLHNMLLSQVAAGVEAMLLQRYPRASDRMKLLVAALLEFLGYHQLLTLERVLATFQALAGRREWGAMRRVGISGRPEGPAPSPVPAPDPAAAATR
jgi:cellulose synthase/poly-beta-1,6-N-acetylglucosamine synthase-like glycosyltransferase